MSTVFVEDANADEVLVRVCQIIARVQGLPEERVRGESSFLELGIESLDAINLLFALEDAFGIKIPMEEGQYRTVEEAVAGVRRHLAAGDAP